MKNATLISLCVLQFVLVGPLCAESQAPEADLLLFSDSVIPMSEDSFVDSAPMAIAVNGERIS